MPAEDTGMILFGVPVYVDDTLKAHEWKMIPAKKPGITIETWRDPNKRETIMRCKSCGAQASVHDYEIEALPVGVTSGLYTWENFTHVCR